MARSVRCRGRGEETLRIGSFGFHDRGDVRSLATRGISGRRLRGTRILDRTARREGRKNKRDNNTNTNSWKMVIYNLYLNYIVILTTNKTENCYYTPQSDSDKRYRNNVDLRS